MFLFPTFASAFNPFDIFVKQNSIITGEIIRDNTQIPNTAKCIDSDGGIFSELAGNVSIRKAMFWGLGDIRYNVYYDYCIRNITLVEYYCDRGVAKTTRFTCKDGCEKGACVKKSEENKLKLRNLNFVYVKVSPKNKGELNPNADVNFGEDIINKRFNHTLKTLKWLTNDDNLTLHYKFIEYKVDENLAYGYLSEEIIEKMVKNVSIYAPDIVIVFFEGMASGIALGERELGNRKTTLVMGVQFPLTNPLEHDLEDFTILTIHELFHLSKFGDFKDAQYTWCGWFYYENPSIKYPLINCYFHSIYGAGGYSYEYPPFLVYAGKNIYKEISHNDNNTYILTINNTCKNEDILRISDGKIPYGSSSTIFFNLSYIFTLTDTKSCTNEFEYADIPYGVKIWRHLESNQNPPDKNSYEIPFRYEKNQNGEYSVLNPITFSDFYFEKVINEGNFNDIRKDYSDENYEIRVLNESIGTSGEIISMTLLFKIKKDELKDYRIENNLGGSTSATP